MANVATGSVLLSVKFDNITSSINSQLGKAFSSASKTASAAGSSTGSGFSTGFAAKLGGIAGIVGTGVSAAANLVTNSLSSAISRVDTLNNYPVVMQNLGYSAEEASNSLSTMSDHLKGLPTSLDTMASTVQGIVAVTGDLDQATNAGLALNDMLLASGSNSQVCSAAMEQFRQMLAKGKPDMQDWKSLTSAMPGQMKQLAEAMLGTGATADDLYSALGGGGAEATISTNDLLDAMIALDQDGSGSITSFSEQAKTATAGIGTSIENANSAIVRGVGKILESFGQGSLSQAISNFGSAAETGLTAVAGFLSSYVVPAFTAFKDVVSNAFSAVSGFISEHSAVIGTVLSTLGGLVGTFSAQFVISTSVIPAIAAKFAAIKTALAPLTSTLSLLGGNFVQLVSKMGLVRGAVTFMISGFSPITVVVALIAALAAGMAYFFTQTEAGQAALSTITSLLSDGLGGAMEQLSPLLQSLGETLTGALATALPTIGEALTSLATLISGVIIAVLPTVISIVTQIGTVLLQVAQAILPVIISVVQSIASFITANMPLIQSIITTAMTAIQAIVNAVWPVIQDVITAAMNIIQAVITTVMAAINGDWDGVWNGIQSILSAVWDDMRSIVSSVIAAINSVISGALGTIQGIWSGAWSAVQSVLQGAWDGIRNGVQSGISAVVGFVSGIPGQIVSALGNVGSLLYNAGCSIINGLMDGIKATIQGVFSFVSGIADTIASLKGPLPYDRKVLIPNGEALMQSLGTGLESGFGDVENLVGGMAGTLADDMTISANGVWSLRANEVNSNAKTSVLDRLDAIADKLDKQETAIYLDSKKVASTMAKPMNRQLGRLQARGY
jgi:tape measure domain-containing protein